ncbi:MAG: hypothetical protein HY403_02435 [Elusimicrobia bacterium]|nr:hypothetical protein [Elusimicrobiota bacterium]
MKALALILCLTGLAAAAGSSGPDEKTRIKIVEYMLKTPLDEADPALVSGFMKLDPEALPKKLRDKARGKQMQIDAIVKIHNGKKKGPLRYPSTACTPKRYGPEGVRIMTMIKGNEEIAGEEEEYVELKTGCTEDQLICEFSLNVVVIPRPGKAPLKRFYLMDADPLMALVAEKRGGGGSAGNRYFQELKPRCDKS